MKFVEDKDILEFKLNFDNVISLVAKMNMIEFSAVYNRMYEDRMFSDDFIRREYEKFRIDFPAFYCMLSDFEKRAFLKDILEYFGYSKVEK